MRFVSPILIRAAAIVLFVVLGLSACTVVVEDDADPVRPGPICTREYDPVCGRRDGERRTFANACLADEAGYRIVRRGECRRDDDGGGQYCTQQYDPVCARRGGDRRTFANSCVADQAGYRVIHDGECRRRDDDDDGGPRFCTREYAPVCARRGGNVRTFPNSCEAEVAGFRIISDGPC